MYGEIDEFVSYLCLRCKIKKTFWNACYIWIGELTLAHYKPNQNFIHFVSQSLNKVKKNNVETVCG